VNKEWLLAEIERLKDTNIFMSIKDSMKFSGINLLNDINRADDPATKVTSLT
jgi:hypothetical protein